MVTKPVSLPFLSTRGSFSTLERIRIFLASSRVVPAIAVTSLSLGVITVEMGTEKSVINRISRLVRIPTSVPSASQMGTPLILYLRIRSSASWAKCRGERKNGLVMTPFSERFTLSTSVA